MTLVTHFNDGSTFFSRVDNNKYITLREEGDEKTKDVKKIRVTLEEVSTLELEVEVPLSIAEGDLEAAVEHILEQHYELGDIVVGGDVDEVHHEFIF